MHPLTGIALTAVLLLLQPTAHADDANAQPGKYGAEAREVMAYFQKTFLDPKTGVYIRSATDRKPDYIWRQAAAFSAMVGAAREDPKIYRPLLGKYFKALDQYWDAKVAIPAYEPAPTRGNGNDKYYDDNAWIVITFAEAYQLTHDPAYLNRARETAQFVYSGWDNELGGGIWWHQTHKDNSKNTCANGPGAEGFLCLARLGPRTDAGEWLDRAKKTVDWTCEKLQAKDGLFEDRVIVATGEVKKGKLTYNSALMMRACLDLYHQTGEKQYLDQASRIGKAAGGLTDRATGVWRDPLKWSQFMVEADIALYRTTGEEYLMTRARTNADAYYAAWKTSPSDEMMSIAGTARILWLMADTETDAGKAFWKEADQPGKPNG